ncbi:hypothetical protein THAOC_01540, partial [Thalassiosira oceanica]
IQRTIDKEVRPTFKRDGWVAWVDLCLDMDHTDGCQMHELGPFGRTCLVPDDAMSAAVDRQWRWCLDAASRSAAANGGHGVSSGSGGAAASWSGEGVSQSGGSSGRCAALKRVGAPLKWVGAPLKRVGAALKWVGNVNPVFASSSFKHAVAEKLRSQRSAKWGESNVHCCAYYCRDGQCYWTDWNIRRGYSVWQGSEPLVGSGMMGLLLDPNEGTMSVFKNGRRLGVMKEGLGGETAGLPQYPQTAAHAAHQRAVCRKCGDIAEREGSGEDAMMGKARGVERTFACTVGTKFDDPSHQVYVSYSYLSA